MVLHLTLGHSALAFLWSGCCRFVLVRQLLGERWCTQLRGPGSSGVLAGVCSQAQPPRAQQVGL